MCGELKGPKKARILLVKLCFAGSWQSRDVITLSETIDVSRYNTDDTFSFNEFRVLCLSVRHGYRKL